MPARVIDMTNKQVGRWTILKQISSPKPRMARWECKCECGNYGQVYGIELRKGTSLSCGCLRVQRFIASLTKHGLCGTPEYAMWKAAKRRAKLSKLEFDIQPSDIIIPEICPILKITLIAGVKKQTKNSPSLDRINSSKGYVKNNIKVISYRANQVKSNLTSEQLRSLWEYSLNACITL